MLKVPFAHKLSVPWAKKRYERPKIFDIGHGKCGTQSLTRAMTMLGFKSVHWLKPGGGPLRHHVENNIKANRNLLYGFEDYEFYSNFMGELYFKRLDKEYPRSKFIFPDRDLDSWLLSMENHVLLNQKNRNYKYGNLTVNKDLWTKRWYAHRESIDHYFCDREHDLLRINIINGEGWDKMCPFFGVDIPNEPFPKMNVTKNKLL